MNRILNRYLLIEGLDDDENRGVVRWTFFFAATAVALRLFFWYYTGRNWEDALITVLHAENFVRGLGLTHYRVGEAPLHGFTSPLSVLVPLAGEMMRPGFGLPFIKLVSAICGGLTILYALAIGIHPKVKLPGPLVAMVMGYLACEHHQILWGTAGMETQMATLVLLMSAYYALARRPIALGLSLGLCMLARPDFAFWTVICGAYALVLFPRKLPYVVGAAFAVYLPWIVFTLAYYGSPMPNTILAKSLGYPLWTRLPDLRWRGALRIVWDRVTPSYGPNAVFQALGPSFAGHGVNFRPIFHDRGAIAWIMLSSAAVGAVAIVRRRQSALAPIMGFVLVYAVYYVFFVAAVFGWYVPPFAAMAVLLSARGLQALGGTLPWPGARRTFLGAFCAAYVLLFVCLLPLTFTTERRIQRDIEDRVRKQVGLYLADVMEPDETVGCEPLGHIAYYSRRTVYDWPGLASRRVVEYTKTHPEERSLERMLETLRPDYIVLRYGEYANDSRETWLDSDYRAIASFEADPNALVHIFGVKDNLDTGFMVLARNGLPRKTPSPPLGIAPDRSRGWNSFGKRLVRQQRNEDALPAFQKAIAADSHYAEAHNNLGAALSALGRDKEALAEYERALAIDPKYVNAHNNLARSLANLGRYNQASAEYQTAIRLAPRDPAAFLLAGNMARRHGRADEAVSYFEQALAADSRSAEAQWNLASVLIELGRTDEGEARLRTLIQENPGYAWDRVHEVADALLRAGEVDEAASAYERFIEVDRDWPAARIELGNLRVRQGRIEDALREYRTAAELDPQNGDVYFNLGAVAQTLGRVDDAIVFLEKAAALNPDDDAVRTRLEEARKTRARQP